jgi:hypothetical protein
MRAMTFTVSTADHTYANAGVLRGVSPGKQARLATLYPSID